MDKEYALVNNKYILSEIGSSHNFDCVLYEYLSAINKEFKILVSYGVKLKTISFDHMFIVEKKKGGFTTPYISNIIKFNFNTFSLDTKRNKSFIPQEYPFNELIEEIKSNCSIITGEEKVRPISRIITPQKKQNNSLLVKPRKIDLTKRLIPTVSPNDSDEDSDGEFNKKPFSSLSKLKDNGLFENSSDGDISEVSLSDVDSDIEEENILSKYKELQNIKKREVEKLKDIKNTLKKDTNNYSKFFTDLSHEKQILNKEKDREDEKIRQFEADKKVYSRMKLEIVEGKLNEEKITPMLNMDKKYQIFKFMDAQGLLNENNDFIIFKNLFVEAFPDCAEKKEEKKLGYVPHNYHYLSPEEQEKYKDTYENVKNNMKDKFLDFMSETKNEKKYMTEAEIDEYLDDLDSDDQICDDDVDFDSEKENNEVQ